MSLEKRKVVNVILLVSVVFLMNLFVYASSPLQLLFIACNGELSLAGEERNPSKQPEKKWIGDVPRGFLYGDNFFAIDSNELIFSNLVTKESGTLANLQTVVDSNYRPWLIGYVDNNAIYFSAQKYDKNVAIDKQEHHSIIYRFDRGSKETEKIDLHECRSPYFSVQDGKIYFVDVSGEISEFAEGKTKSLGIKGDFPSISPDGEKIAFASFGLINDHVYLYEINKKNKVSLISFLGPKGVNPIIRWSEDSAHIAVKKKSDLTSGPLFLINAKSSKVAQKCKKSHACNWFFVDK